MPPGSETPKMTALVTALARLPVALLLLALLFLSLQVVEASDQRPMVPPPSNQMAMEQLVAAVFGRPRADDFAAQERARVLMVLGREQMLLERLRRDGLQSQEVPGDGDCMLHSLAVLLGRPSASLDIRHEILEHMQQDPDRFAHHITSFGVGPTDYLSGSGHNHTSEQILQAYVQYMQNSGNHADFPLLLAAALLYGREIHVHSTNLVNAPMIFGGQEDIDGFGADSIARPPGTPLRGPAIHIMHLSEARGHAAGHFSPLQQASGPESETEPETATEHTAEEPAEAQTIIWRKADHPADLSVEGLKQALQARDIEVPDLDPGLDQVEQLKAAMAEGGFVLWSNRWCKAPAADLSVEGLEKALQARDIEVPDPDPELDRVEQLKAAMMDGGFFLSGGRWRKAEAADLSVEGLKQALHRRKIEVPDLDPGLDQVEQLKAAMAEGGYSLVGNRWVKAVDLEVAGYVLRGSEKKPRWVKAVDLSVEGLKQALHRLKIEVPDLDPGLDQVEQLKAAMAEGGYSLVGNRWRKARKARKKKEPKPRAKWTEELHQCFVAAVNELGFDNAVPKKVLQLMNTPHLMREQVASHLRTYRSHLKRLAETEKAAQAGSPPSAPRSAPRKVSGSGRRRCFWGPLATECDNCGVSFKDVPYRGLGPDHRKSYNPRRDRSEPPPAEGSRLKRQLLCERCYGCVYGDLSEVTFGDESIPEADEDPNSVSYDFREHRGLHKKCAVEAFKDVMGDPEAPLPRDDTGREQRPPPRLDVFPNYFPPDFTDDLALGHVRDIFEEAAQHSELVVNSHRAGPTHGILGLRRRGSERLHRQVHLDDLDRERHPLLVAEARLMRDLLMPGSNPLVRLNVYQTDEGKPYHTDAIRYTDGMTAVLWAASEGDQRDVHFLQKGTTMGEAFNFRLPTSERPLSGVYVMRNSMNRAAWHAVGAPARTRRVSPQGGGEPTVTGQGRYAITLFNDGTAGADNFAFHDWLGGAGPAADSDADADSDGGSGWDSEDEGYYYYLDFYDNDDDPTWEGVVEK